MGAAFLIPTLLSAAGTAAQYVNQSQANSRQNAAEIQATQNQNNYKKQAAQDVAQTTQTVANDNPAQLQDKATQQYIQTLRNNVGSGTQPGVESSLTGQIGANPRYATAENNSNATVQNFGNTLASEKGATDAAVRQRQNEGLDLGTLSTQLGGINQNSYSQAFADQLKANAAGTPNPWVLAASQALKGYANASSANTPYGSPNTWNNGVPFVSPYNGQLNQDPGAGVSQM